MLSVDAGYGGTLEQANRDVKAMLKKHNIDWTSIVVQGGFNGVVRKFNLNGYGLTLIDANGIAQGIDVRTPELNTLLTKMLGKR